MITDQQTNFIYLSDLLKTKYPKCFKSLVGALDREGIEYGFLENTKDIWARDYMPVQITTEEFVQFKYTPSYLKGFEHLQSNPCEITEGLGIDTIQSDVILDGGNVIKGIGNAILTDNIFVENPDYLKADLLLKIRTELKVNQLTIIPKFEFDFTGHSDGMARFVDENRVLVNDYSNYNLPEFYNEFKSLLHESGLEYLELLSDSWNNKGIDATGDYINYLQIGDIVFVPQFGRDENIDEMALNQFENVFPNCKNIPVYCGDIAKQGGVLNCISWNILK